VGCLALYHVWHADGLWVAPEKRKRGTVGRALQRAVRLWAEHWGVDEVVGMARSTETSAMMQRFGVVTPLVCEQYAVKIGA
jgi:hypothetical protein